MGIYDDMYATRGRLKDAVDGYDVTSMVCYGIRIQVDDCMVQS